ncbi:hypothetical protein [Butyrivibrio sp. AE3006]|uniref:hypothetical protein n=1 Tax=Butyrivibrio sp. AE3006 TaxID=1280673 RepID=UPI00042A224A|nr:hypothetical protein [Butyrivibrio sp. AE3006]
MKIYEIVDEGNNISIGVLLFYEKERTFIIELQEGLDEWTAPLLLTSYVKKGIHTIPRDISLLWVKERIIPSGRQNIGSILNTHRLKEYDEMRFLELSNGRCSQDSLYIKKLDELPTYVINRQNRNLSDCTPIRDSSLLCFFADNTVRKTNLGNLFETKDKVIDIYPSIKSEIDKILRYPDLFSSCKVGTGGYFVSFNDSIDIPSSLLYDTGELIPLTPDDFFSFAKKNLLDTTQCCDILECSRQNISYMVQQGQLSPIKENVKGNLYSYGEVLKNKW